jgi:Mrp family chromosome partitioning ATPase
MERLGVGQFRAGAWGDETEDLLARHLDALRGQSARVLVELEPLRESAQALHVARLLDGVLVVVEAQRERREVLGQTIEVLQRAPIRILGAVINKRTRPIPEFLYRWL